MTPRERFIAALERKALFGRVPHFELVFFLTMKAFGRVHPSHRNYHQWQQMSERERKLHRRDMAELYIATIKHTDGNIMPILDQLIQAGPHALHSLDPQGGVDIAEVKRRYGDRVCLIGNVNCGLLDTGSEADAIESARYALRHGMPGGGYIFSTSNCVYTGMRLERYEAILDVWRKEGNYPDGETTWPQARRAD